MKIKMLTTASSPSGSLNAGSEYEVGVGVSKEQAEAFLQGGYARKVEDKPVEAPKVEPKDEIENAMVEPVAETADVKVPKGKKGKK